MKSHLPGILYDNSISTIMKKNSKDVDHQLIDVLSIDQSVVFSGTSDSSPVNAAMRKSDHRG